MKNPLTFVYLAATLIIIYCEATLFKIPHINKEKESTFWLKQGAKEIDNAILLQSSRPLQRKAKNVILFIGDGFGNAANTAGRIYKGQKRGHSGEEESLAWEKFTNLALLKTYSLDRQVADSAATATALLGGIKANQLTLGVNGKVNLSNCEASLKQENWVTSFIEWGQQAGKDSGIISTARLTHATPGAAYAHTSNRLWECDSKVPPEFRGKCKDIARQLIEDEPGKNINVIFGGGRRQFGASLPGDSTSFNYSCVREDELNLATEWKKDKKKRGYSYAYLNDKSQFQDGSLEERDFLFGLFSEDHLPYELDRQDEVSPSLAELTEVALRRLSRRKEGFVLLVEGGRIDHGLHATQPKRALEEVLAMDEAVDMAVKMTDPDETLVIVTADHSHSFAITGYPKRGNDILGKADIENAPNNLPYTTIMFTIGPGNQYIWNGTHVTRKNISEVDTTGNDYVFPSLVTQNGGNHAGEDVVLWAQGPSSELFHKVHEQSYVAHVIGRAACLGPYKNKCPKNEKIKASAGSRHGHSLLLLLSSIALMFQ